MKKIRVVETLIKCAQSRDGCRGAKSIRELRECMKGYVEASAERREL